MIRRRMSCLISRICFRTDWTKDDLLSARLKFNVTLSESLPLIKRALTNCPCWGSTIVIVVLSTCIVVANRCGWILRAPVFSIDTNDEFICTIRHIKAFNTLITYGSRSRATSVDGVLLITLITPPNASAPYNVRSSSFSLLRLRFMALVGIEPSPPCH